LQLPVGVDPERIVAHSAGRHTVRDLASRIDAKHPITLHKGKTITAQKYVDMIAAYQKAANVRLSNLPRKHPIKATTKKTLDEHRARVEKHLEQLRQASNDKWKSILDDHARQATSAFGAKARRPSRLPLHPPPFVDEWGEKSTFAVFLDLDY